MTMMRIMMIMTKPELLRLTQAELVEGRGLGWSEWMDEGGWMTDVVVVIIAIIRI